MTITEKSNLLIKNDKIIIFSISIHCVAKLNRKTEREGKVDIKKQFLYSIVDPKIKSFLRKIRNKNEYFITLTSVQMCHCHCLSLD